MLFLSDGGVIGVGLLVGFVIGVNVTLLRRFRIAVREERWEDAGLLRVLLVLFDAFFVAAAFNPVIEGMSRSATIFGLYAVAMLIGRVGPRRLVRIWSEPSASSSGGAGLVATNVAPVMRARSRATCSACSRGARSDLSVRS